ncbi:MAG: hypothetical protein NUV98_05870, partial [Candidatus Roizmanbacteria bacterium]|nr:hypothetical protein [Candidatus Roizmanbacteria bacterium]
MSSTSTGKKVIRILSGSRLAPMFDDPGQLQGYVEEYIERAERVVNGLPTDGGPEIDEWGFPRQSNYDGWTLEHTEKNLQRAQMLRES